MAGYLFGVPSNVEKAVRLVMAAQDSSECLSQERGFHHGRTRTKLGRRSRRVSLAISVINSRIPDVKELFEPQTTLGHFTLSLEFSS